MAMTLSPFGQIKKANRILLDKAGQRIAAREAADNIVANEAGRVTVGAAERTAANQVKNTAGKYANGYRRASFTEAVTNSAKLGAEIGEATGLGFVGAGIVGATAGAVRGLGKVGVSMLSPKARSVYRALEESALHKYQAVYDKLLPKTQFGRAAAIYGGRVARNTIASGFSEAAEEAVQYLNSNEDYASKYGWNGMSLADAFINDFYQGTRVANTYLAMLGLTDSELMSDPEYWSNYQGGFALSMFHTGTIRMAVEGYNAYKEMPIHNAILTTGIMNRELEAHDRAANTEFARQAMRKRTDETLDVLDWMERNDSRRE
jgi:hypothetical protein